MSPPVWGIKMYHSAKVMQSIFNFNPINASVIYQIPLIHWISDSFRENSIGFLSNRERNKY